MAHTNEFIELRAQEVLRLAGALSVPVDLERVAAALEVRVHDEELESEVSGVLIVKAKSATYLSIKLTMQIAGGSPSPMSWDISACMTTMATVCSLTTRCAFITGLVKQMLLPTPSQEPLLTRDRNVRRTCSLQLY